MHPTHFSESPCSSADAALRQSSLHLTRAAIARWSGSAPVHAPQRALPRISPQARWLAEAQYGLAAWIARGGFAQDDCLPIPTQAQPACID